MPFDAYTAMLLSAGVFPPNLTPVVAGGLPQNAWGGNVIIWPNGARKFRIAFYRTPPDACMRIASAVANLGTADGPVALITNCGGTVINIKNAGVTVGLTTAELDAACQKNSVISTSSTEFDFMLR